jgi:uncharacterized repeat protein (TIGR03803 family)
MRELSSDRCFSATYLRRRKEPKYRSTLGLSAAWIVLLFCGAMVIAAPAQTFTTLTSFDGINGNNPWGALVQGTDGNFYGTTSAGGTSSNCNNADSCGTIFTITPSGTLTSLYSFCLQKGCPDGSTPTDGLMQATDGNFYGTTQYGGNANNAGTIFKMTPRGTLTTIYRFCSQPGCTDGEFPFEGLEQSADGSFYGTSQEGGSGNHGGTVFKITPAGELTTLYSFCSQPNCSDGNDPDGLVEGSDGNFYGTTLYGGVPSGEFGTVFKITPEGAMTTLYSFCSQPDCTDGYYPVGNLVQGTDGNFYGTTNESGLNGGGGTVFTITPSGALSTLYTFCSQPKCADGAAPYGGLVQAADGDFYGTTSESATVFEITPAGELTTLYTFCSQPDCADGSESRGGLVQGTDGTFYGMTLAGGNPQCGQGGGCGTVFSLSVGLPPFVEPQTNSRKEGASVVVLGNNLAGATSVSFNGMPATFKAKNTEIRTRVPFGASTGTLTVTTPKGTLQSNEAFRVTPQLTSFMPKKGSVGMQVTITGVSLTQTTAVAFGGVAATEFTVNSDTQVTTIVPAGAATGKVAITTAGGTVTSGGNFKVTK